MISLAFGMPGWPELLVILFLGILIFGRRLPEVGRSLGRTIVEFKKGVKNVQNEINEVAAEPDAPTQQISSGSPAMNDTPAGDPATQARDTGTTNAD